MPVVDLVTFTAFLFAKVLTTVDPHIPVSYGQDNIYLSDDEKLYLQYALALGVLSAEYPMLQVVASRGALGLQHISNIGVDVAIV